MATESRAIELKLILSSQGDFKLAEGEKTIKALVEVSDKAATGFSRMNIQLQRLIEGFERFTQVSGARAGGEQSLFGQAFGGSFLGTLTGNLLPRLVNQLGRARDAAVDFFEDTFKSVVRASEQYERFQISLEGVLRSQEAAQRVSRLAFQAGANSPFGIGDLEKATQQLIKVPQLRGNFFGPEKEVEENLKRLYDLTIRLASIDPDRGIPGAVQAIRTALQGQFRLLTRQYNISIGELVAASGKSARELKTNSDALLDALRTVSERLVTDDTIERLKSQVSTRVSNIKEYLDTIIPRSIGGKGFYDTVKRLLGFVDEELLAFVSPGGSFETKFAQRFSDSFSRIVGGAARSIAAILGTTLNVTGQTNPFEGIADALATFSEKVATIVENIATFLESGSGRGLIKSIGNLFLSIGRALATAIDSLINLLGRLEQGIKAAKAFLPGSGNAPGDSSLDQVVTEHIGSDGQKFYVSGPRSSSAGGSGGVASALSQFEQSFQTAISGGGGGGVRFFGNQISPTDQLFEHIIKGFKDTAAPFGQVGDQLRETIEKSLLTPLEQAKQKFEDVDKVAEKALKKIQGDAKDAGEKFNLLTQLGLLGDDPAKLERIAKSLDAAFGGALEDVTESSNLQKLEKATALLKQLVSIDPQEASQFEAAMKAVEEAFKSISAVETSAGARLLGGDQIRFLTRGSIQQGLGAFRRDTEGFTAFGGGERSQIAQNNELIRLLKSEEGVLGRNFELLRNIVEKSGEQKELAQAINELLGIQTAQLERQNAVLEFRKGLSDAEEKFQNALAGVTTGGVAGQSQRQGIVAGRISQVQHQLDALDLEFETGLISVAEYTGKMNALEDVLKGLTRQNDDFTRSITEQTRQIEIQRRLQETFGGNLVQALNLNTTDPTTGEPRIRSFGEVAAQEGAQFGTQFVLGVQRGIGDSLYNLFKGNFDSIGEAWQSFLDSMLRAFADMLSQMLVRGLFSQVFGGFFGGLTGGGAGGGGGGGGFGSILGSASSFNPG